MAHKAGALTLSAIFVLFLIASYSVGGAKGGRAVAEGEVGGAKGGRAVAEGEVVHPDDALCEKPSQTWSGYCGNTNACNNQCIQWESARHGVCQWSGLNRKCLCYYDQCP